ncbi:ATP-binding protein [Oceanospirillum sediminis]|uniref:histidine kinase n=1 Tax=Oceanospirillum sediminis TaxID=2760088 RepID=A0A839IT95_9GAMM|nr:ATP-binding protein [Oceanospirillum sediminis]MBB1488188.1 response regulator [Oceanospirillum sediminis]
MTFWLKKRPGYARQHPLGYRIMVYVSVCSFIFILCSTALQLSLDYRRELKAMDQQTELIRSSYLASLAKSLWDVDQAQVELQLLGIHTLPDVIYLTLEGNHLSPELQLPVHTPLNAGHQVQLKSFELIHTTRSQQQRHLGQLNVSFDMEAVYARVWQTGASILFNQTLLVLLIVLVILVIVQRQITRHLESMADYSRRIGAGDLASRLTLERIPPEQPDELDQLAAALNEMGQAVQRDRDQLQQMVEKRTASLRRAKEAAEDASNAKSQFLSTMSHEIRTPMNGMLGMIQLLENSPLTDNQREHIRVLHDATDALMETFDHVLQYGRLVEGAYVSQQTEFSLTELLKNLITLMTPGAERKGLTTQLYTDPALSHYYCGAAGSLRQILTNLLANAIKFTDSGSVRLSCRLSAEEGSQHRIRFEVIDSGIGIETQLQQHIFDRFTQADESITRRFGGTGLGLAICKELAQTLGGDIGVHSEPDKGSCFWLELTLSPVESESKAIEKQTPISENLRGEILLVEDVEINQQVVLGLLGDRYPVTLAEDGHKALAMCQHRAFDLILMDMHLPGLSGMEVSRQLRSDPSAVNFNTPIVALTASVRPEDVHRYLQAGMQYVVAKPVKREQLFSALQACLARQSDTELALSPDILPDVATPDTADPERIPLLDQGVLDLHRRMLGEQKVTDLMRNFIALYQELWPLLEASLLESDLYETSQLSHKLAGACETLGLARLGTLLRMLETDADMNDLEACLQNLPDLQRAGADTLALIR